jgi:diguanylate cyclase (GGDEF)-like protein/PAS domain S-box-containing protein
MQRELDPADRSLSGERTHERAILDTVHEAFVAMDAGGFIIDWNPQAEATFGWSRQEAVGRILADTIIPARYRDRHWNGLQHYIETGEGAVIDKRIEIEALHREGFEFPIEMTIGVRRDGETVFFNAFLHDISDRRRAALYVEAQHIVTRILAEAGSEEEVIAGLLSELGGLMEWEFGALWRVDQRAGCLVCAETWTIQRPEVRRFAAESRNFKLRIGEGLPGRVWAERRPALITDVDGDDNFPRDEEAAEAGLHAAIGFPLTHQDTPLGMIEFMSRAIGQTDERLLDALGSIGTQVGQHLTVLRERAALLARMAAMAHTDELTGLPNRRAWDEELERELARAHRSGERFSVAMVDLDHFKAFNDAFGHQAGDRLLADAAAAWSTEVRSTDFLARYGGEEFALLLLGCPPESATPLIERLRAVTPRDQTCSAGIAVWDGEEEAENLVARADAALYAAKRGGRDRIVLAGGEGHAE